MSGTHGPVARRGALRVAFCHHTSDPGGGSDRSLFELVTHLPQARICPLMLIAPDDPMADAYRQAGIAVAGVAVATPRRSRNPMALIRFALGYHAGAMRVAQQLKAWGADLAHVNTSVNVVCAEAARMAGLPLVWHVRELMLNSRGGAAIRRRVCRRADRVVAISEAVGATLAEAGEQRRVVMNGIGLSWYSPAETGSEVRRALGISESAPVILLAGRIEPWKGQHVAVAAMPAVLRAHPKAHLLMAGAAARHKPGYADQLRAQCAALGVSEHVQFLGPRSDIPALLATSTVALHTSVEPEPFGRTVVEAMAAGRPVIAADAGGPREILAESGAGLLVAPDDAVALADALLRVLDDPVAAAAMGARGRVAAAARFDVTRTAEEMAGIFEELYTARQRAVRQG